MTEYKIDKYEIGETMVYDFECPACKSHSEFYEDEPENGDSVICEHCHEIILVVG